MADIQKRLTAGGTKWDVRYRDETLRQRKKTFDRKVDAQRFANSVETDLAPWRLDRPEPRAGAVRRLGRHVAGDDRQPQAEDTRVVRVDRAQAPRARASARRRSGRSTTRSCSRTSPSYARPASPPKTVRNIRDVMRMIFKLAVRSGALKSNPVEDVPVGQTQRAEMVFLEPDQIMTSPVRSPSHRPLPAR